MRNKFILLSILFLACSYVKGQTPTVVIEEDYSKPDSRLYVAGDEFVKRDIENGMYVAKAGRMYPVLDFGFKFKPYNNPQDKYDSKDASDMEFTVVKLKGDKEDFISVGINYLYLQLSYNEKGEWKFTNYNEDKIYQQGKTEINSGSNQLLFSHRGDRLRCYINGKQIMEYAFTQDQDWKKFLEWQNLQVFSKNKKMVIALDKVVLKGYPSFSKYPDEISKEQKQELVKEEKTEAPKKATNQKLKRFETKIQDKWKYGFKGEDKSEVIPAIYDRAEEFSEELAAVEQNGKWGFIDKTGKEVIPFKFDGAGNFSHGFAVVYKGSYPNTKQGLINKQGEEVLPAKYQMIYGNLFSEGVYVVSIDKHMGFVDSTGKEVGTIKYEDVGRFTDGMARVKQNGKWGFIDRTGKEIIAPKYSGVQDFSGGFCAVNIGGKDESSFRSVLVEGGKWGFINKAGKEITPVSYNDVVPFSEGVGLYQQVKNGAWTMIDSNGKKTPLQYNVVQAPFSDGHALAGMYAGGNSKVKWTVIDKTGKNKMPLTTEWEPAHTIGFSEGLCGVFAVKKDEVKVGYIDTNGKLVIPFTYAEAEPFKNGKAEVELDGRSFYIDKNGQEIK